MRLFYIPHQIRCPSCQAVLWTEATTADGRIFLKCISRRCSRNGVRVVAQLPHVEATEIEED